MSRVRVARYSAEHKILWDDFVRSSKNGIFLFERDYLEYHADRFPDYSLLFFDDAERLLAVLPATLKEDVLSSHAGLTFGGLVSTATMKVELMLEVFEATRLYLQERDVAKVIYKAIPHIYHQLPAQEDLYALFRYDARLFRRDVSSTLQMNQRPPFSKGRRYAIKVGRKHGIEVRRSLDFSTFMSIEEHVLGSKYGVAPVHTAAEIGLLAERFPENIKLFAAYKQEMLAGVIIYESAQVAHAQYIGVSEEGQRIGGLDLIMDHLIEVHYADKKYFDFGISTEDNGKYLNQGLIKNKQSFGGRAVAYDFYEMNVPRKP